jgi:hypothetical protein
MNLIKKTVLAAALSGFAVAASAMTPMADESLSQVSGQDGVSIAADLNIKVGEFKYTNTNRADALVANDTADDASISFRGIDINGSFAMSMEVIRSADFNTGTAGEAFSVLGLTGGTDAGTFHARNSDVVKISIPQLTVNDGQKLNFSIDAITMGNAGGAGNGKSFGSIAMNDIQLQGTKVYIWAKN